MKLCELSPAAMLTALVSATMSAGAAAQCPDWSTQFGFPPSSNGSDHRIYDLRVGGDQEPQSPESAV